jgi:serine/threonine-protein kinase
MSDSSSPRNGLSDIDLAGQTLGGYHVLRKLGRGATAFVFLAEQLSLKRQVALKILRPELATDSTYVRRFQMEAQAAAALVHANIVQIFEVGEVDSKLFIAQEYVPGINLRDLLAKHGPPEVAHSLAIVRQVAAALAKAAEAGIIHRDIKPDNVLLSDSGDVKVADFGLARIVDSKVSLTQSGFTMGTPLYMSPEQIEGKPLDPRSDLYSLGVMAYHMLAGEPPFRGETAINVAVQHLQTKPPSLHQLRPDVPTKVCEIVERLMAKRPDDRFESAKALLRALRETAPEELGGYDTEQLAGLAQLPAAMQTARQAVTQRLSTAMVKKQALRGKTLLYVWAGLTMLAAFGCGLLWARARQTPWLLKVNPADIPAVQRMATAAEQFELAELLATQEGYESVRKYFPEPQDAKYVRYAQRDLAMMLLQRLDFEQAYQAAGMLVALPDTEVSLRATGLAVQTISLAARQESSATTMAELRSLRGKLDGATVQVIGRMFNDALRQRHISVEELRQWSQSGTRPGGRPVK